MEEPKEFGEHRLRSRPSETVMLSIPSDTLELIRRIATAKEMTAEALLKFYIGQGLRANAEGEGTPAP